MENPLHGTKKSSHGTSPDKVTKPSRYNTRQKIDFLPQKPYTRFRCGVLLFFNNTISTKGNVFMKIETPCKENSFEDLKKIIDEWKKSGIPEEIMKKLRQISNPHKDKDNNRGSENKEDEVPSQPIGNVFMKIETPNENEKMRALEKRVRKLEKAVKNLEESIDNKKDGRVFGSNSSKERD